ncbi:DNA methyltransferase [Chloroflexota bacterium]
MAKKRNTQQLSFFKKEIPQMPDGYYSGDQPNPNLARFVEEHAIPYDPDADEYNVPPFDQPITTTKATAIYNMHTYWSKKPHDAIRQYIHHYTQPDDIVLDPFCGSGGTALAALMEGRAAIAIDRSPAATFITKNYCTPVDVDELQAAFDDLAAKVKPEIDWLYETRCDRCDGRAKTLYVVYSQVIQCTRCLENVKLFDCVEATGQTVTGRPKKISACPNCYQSGHIEEISTRAKKLGAVPVLIKYECLEGCRSPRGERVHNDSSEKKRDFFEQYDLKKIREIENKEIPYWTSQDDIRGVGTRYLKDGLHLLGIETISDLYTCRNLWALALLRKWVTPEDPLAIAFSSVSLSASRLYRHRTTGGGGPKGTDYYIAPINREMNVWDLFSRRFDNVSKPQPLQVVSTNLSVSTQSATNLNQITSNSIDYIFTDPPYSGTIQYGELNYVWESWLRFDTKWQAEEITVNEVRQKTESDWANMMTLALEECYRVLKPGHWLSLCYHDTSEGTWQLVQDLMTQTGFIPEHTEQTLFIDTGGGTYNQVTADKATKRDLVINFRKPRLDEITQLMLFGTEDPATFQQKARAILVEALEAHPGSPADRLYDELVSRMVRKGEFERHNFEQLLHSVAEEVDGRWYLLDTAGQLDEAESAKEEAAATRLEAFMWAQAAQTFEVSDTSKVWAEQVWPSGFGVHYSDLFEQYLPVKDKPRRLLQEWLPEFFFKTEEGTWRPPATAEERQQKAELRTGGTLRRIKRFAKALLEGVPPFERDRPPNPATAADWLRQCRRAGLYELGRAIYEKGGFDFEALGEENYMELEEDYQLCVRRTS